MTVAIETYDPIPGISHVEEARLSLLAGGKGAGAAADADALAESVDEYVYSRPYSAATIALVAGFVASALRMRHG